MKTNRIDTFAIEQKARALRAQEMARLMGILKRRLFGKKDQPVPQSVGAH